MNNLDNIGKHHQHVRKRLYKNLEEYPHNNKYKHIMDVVVYFGSFFGVLITIPQVWTIWIDHNVSGVSLFTWGGYFIAAIMWLIYGFLHKEKPIIISNGFSVILYAMICAGILVYG